MHCSLILPTSQIHFGGRLPAVARQLVVLPYRVISPQSLVRRRTNFSAIRIEIIVTAQEFPFLPPILHQIAQRGNGLGKNERIAIFLQTGRDRTLPIQ